ncbi:MAG: fumarylacetoacetate hydrolase family protein [Alphaproteobacteria bacterium]|nr:fumarylacetoacetate hydrolase family protein [Alphaproteobacteria bacterium]
MLDSTAPATLAASRRAGTLAQVRLQDIASRAKAEAFQAEAIRALGGEPCGYKIGATSSEVQQLLACREPIYAPLLREHVLASGTTFPLPAGLMGIECEFGFVMGRDFPAANETADIAAARSAVAECFVGLELVGRRVAPNVPLNERTAIADFSLDVAVVRGAPIPEWERHDLATMPVRAVVDGATLASGTGAAVLGHPLNSLLWLAAALSKRGQRLRKGEIIFTGTCTGITKVAAGQLFEGRFADLPAVEVRLA